MTEKNLKTFRNKRDIVKAQKQEVYLKKAKIMTGDSFVLCFIFTIGNLWNKSSNNNINKNKIKMEAPIFPKIESISTSFCRNHF